MFIHEPQFIVVITLLFSIAVAKAIVELHEGRIWVESAGEGYGSTFSVDIPLNRPSVAGSLRRRSLEQLAPVLHGFSPWCCIFPRGFSFSGGFRVSGGISFSRGIKSPWGSTSPLVFRGLRSSKIFSGNSMDEEGPDITICETNEQVNSRKNIRRNSQAIAKLNKGSDEDFPHTNQFKEPRERLQSFSVRPKCDMEEWKSISDRPNKSVEIVPKARPNTLRVLVVDDVLSNRKMLARSLDDKYEVTMADDGDVAVSRVLEAMGTPNAYDVILMDNQMNRMNGPIAAKTLREKGFVGVIVGVTGNALRQDVEDYLAHGADEVIGKPVDVDFLERRIAGRAILKRWLLCITV